VRLRARAVFLILLVAAIASAFSTTIAYQVVRSDDRVPDVFALAVLNTTFWFGWAALALPLTALTERWRVDRTPRVAIPLHIVAIITAGALHICLQTSTQSALWVRAAMRKGLDHDYVATFLTRFDVLLPSQLLQLIDWEIASGIGVVALAHAFFYYRETQARAIREANLETRLMESQLQTLQQQLQPHFLFNTLHAVSALMHRDVNAADRVLARLSDLLRLTLDSGTHKEIRLSREMEFISKYLDIEKARLGDRLKVDIDVEPDTLDAMVPTLLLQPLVENAIKHGVAPHTGPGHIDIKATRKNGELIVSISDNGPSAEATSSRLVNGNGIGLTNIRARLVHHFGDHGELDLDRRPTGFTARVTIPFRM
jgi:two-component system LytT family sensor kinase